MLFKSEPWSTFHLLLQSPLTMLQMVDLPNELLFHIFGDLNLTSLIAARGVCHRWKSIVSSANTIHPARRSLLDLYLRAVNSPTFLPTRPHILPHLQTFNREEFYEKLPMSTPDEFKVWILEWPQKAVIGWLWPGLPSTALTEPNDISLRARGESILSYPNAPCLCQYTLGNPSLNRDQLRNLTNNPIMCYSSNLWNKLSRNTIDITVLYICSKDPSVDNANTWVDFVVEAGEGGEHLLGNLYHFDFGDEGEVANNWVEFLHHEIDYEEWEFAGGRYNLADLYS
ncbi:hypothetical protein C8Q75DRAFT_536677 [Abortiporus biennis]|nr:hypothetical protein C8Q75DRAFT_536677 [Abortiporus biennis]